MLYVRRRLRFSTLAASTEELVWDDDIDSDICIRPHVKQYSRKCALKSELKSFETFWIIIAELKIFWTGDCEVI